MDQPDEFQLKIKEDFRNYEKENVLFDRVRKTYKEMHTIQSVKFVSEKASNIIHYLMQYDLIWSNII